MRRALLLGLSLLAACSGGPFAGERVDAARAEALLKQGAFVLDVRTPGEAAEGMLPGAVLVPLSELSPEKLPQDRGKPVLIYCRSGRRSAAAAKTLKNWGWTRLYDLEGGVLEWTAAGKALSR